MDQNARETVKPSTYISRDGITRAIERREGDRLLSRQVYLENAQPSSDQRRGGKDFFLN